MKKVRGYNFSRSFMGERVPQHIQNIVIKDYCVNNNYNFLLSATEYSMKDSFFILNYLIKNMKEIYGIVAYSLFQMPSDDRERKKIFNTVLKSKKKIFFACENMKLSNKEDLERIEKIWLVKKNMKKKY
jgi:sporadic carbohydrate cluster protein (TIGR04323 family)